MEINVGQPPAPRDVVAGRRDVAVLPPPVDDTGLVMQKAARPNDARPDDAHPEAARPDDARADDA